MTRQRPWLALSLLLTSVAVTSGAQDKIPSHGCLETEQRHRDPIPITVRAGTLAAHVPELAGHEVIVPNARVVGVFDPRAFLVESQSRLQPAVGYRDRVLVLIEPGSLTLPPKSIVASNVTVRGIARTLLGVQTTREVPWPPTLNHSLIERLEVRAAVLATSVQTAEGVELTGRPATPPR